MRHLLVVTCMDARLDVETLLGLRPGEAHILRNAGGSVTDDILRSAIVSTNLMAVRQIMVINHTDCGMLRCTDQSLREQLVARFGPAEHDPGDFYAFSDLDTHTAEQVAILRDHPWIPNDTAIRGFIYDVLTGKLREVACD